MPRGYWIVQNEITDPEGYARYRAAVVPYLERAGARFVVRAGRARPVEGSPGPRHIVIEFDDYEKALAAYESPEYQQLKALRLSSSRGDVSIVEGA
jgi:uncharacterized protein (DUF1330 family)